MTRNQLVATFVLIALAGASMSTTTTARTWRVEKDGSGDYKIIQDAVDVAASGDTVRVGPGRFDDMRLVTTPGWADSVIVQVKQYELTIIGSGPETIIGKDEPWDDVLGDHRKGIATSDYWGNHVLRVEDLKIENMRDGIYTSFEYEPGGTLEVRNCEFHMNDLSLLLIGHFSRDRFVDCRFDQLARNKSHVAAHWHEYLEFDHCEFVLPENHEWNQSHASFNVIQQVRIRDCVFLDGFVGFEINTCSDFVMERCRFDGQENLGVNASILSNVRMVASAFENQRVAIKSSQFDNEIDIDGCTFAGIEEYTFYISFTGGMHVNGCDLSGGVRGIVWCEDRPPCADVMTLDFTQNYWGTDDPDSISSLIRDNNDSSDACFLIDFLPFASESTPKEPRTLGDVKRMFR
jgi:hypothetical protein